MVAACIPACSAPALSSSFPFSLLALNHSARDTFFEGKVSQTMRSESMCPTPERRVGCHVSHRTLAPPATMRSGNPAHCLGHFLYQLGPAVSSFRWMSLDQRFIKILTVTTNYNAPWKSSE